MLRDPWANYDNWKTTPPEPEDVKAGECHWCGDEFQPGEEIIRDSRVGEEFCKYTDCYKEYLLDNIGDEIDEFIELLRNNGDVEDTEAEPEDTEDYGPED